jgi:hypothetical protein
LLEVNSKVNATYAVDMVILHAIVEIGTTTTTTTTMVDLVMVTIQIIAIIVTISIIIITKITLVEIIITTTIMVITIAMVIKVMVIEMGDRRIICSVIIARNQDIQKTAVFVKEMIQQKQVMLQQSHQAKKKMSS